MAVPQKLFLDQCTLTAEESRSHNKMDGEILCFSFVQPTAELKKKKRGGGVGREGESMASSSYDTTLCLASNAKMWYGCNLVLVTIFTETRWLEIQNYRTCEGKSSKSNSSVPVNNRLKRAILLTVGIYANFFLCLEDKIIWNCRKLEILTCCPRGPAFLCVSGCGCQYLCGGPQRHRCEPCLRPSYTN